MVAGGARAGGYTRRNSRRRSSHGAISEINVTPLVDVMLVLLIVFMVAAPLMTVGVPISLPNTDAKNLDAKVAPLSVAIASDHIIYVNNRAIIFDALIPKLDELGKAEKQRRIDLYADESLRYGEVWRVLATLHDAKYEVAMRGTHVDTVIGKVP